MTMTLSFRFLHVCRILPCTEYGAGKIVGEEIAVGFHGGWVNSMDLHTYIYNYHIFTFIN